MRAYRFLIGTYEQDRGIWELELDMAGKQVLFCACASPTRRNSYLALRGEVCYAVSEIPLAEGSIGSLHSFRVSDTGLEKADTLEGLPALLPHLWVNKAGTVVYTASYGTGEILAVRVKDGRFGEILSHTQNAGSSVNPKRQTCAHPHSVWLSPDEKYLYLCDLGTDEVIRWPVDGEGRIVTEQRQSLSVPAGYGPRHMVFSKDGSRAFVLTEMIWHVLEVAVSGDTMTLLRDVSLEGDIPREDQGGGAIRLSADGKTLYCSNRGKENSRIAVLDADTLKLRETQRDCLWPRDFILTQEEEYLLCCNQQEDSVSIFRKNGDGFDFFWNVKNLPSPVCIVELHG